MLIAGHLPADGGRTPVQPTCIYYPWKIPGWHGHLAYEQQIGSKARDCSAGLAKQA
jgi:hypothetical protein